MKRMQHFSLQIVLGLVFAIVLVCLANGEVQAKQNENVQEAVTPNNVSGKYENLTWSITGDTLKITGSGEMKNQSSRQYYPWSDYCDSIKSVVIGDYVTKIGSYAFSDMPEMENVKLGARVKYIEKEAFYNCEKLASIDLHYGIVSIGRLAFYSCDNLSGSVKIPASVKTLGDCVFSKCPKIQEANIYCPINISENTFEDCLSLKKVTIGSQVTGIDAYAFKNTALESVSIPKSVKVIGNGAFYDVWTLKKVTFSSGLGQIANYAFQGTSITSIDIPDSCFLIDEEAFKDCSELKTVKLGTGIKEIDRSVFEDCFELQTVTMSDNVKMIDINAFAYCTKLESITWPKNLEQIHEAAFYECRSLTNVVFGEKLESIGREAFYNCILIEEIELDKNVINIDEYAFFGCISLQKFISYSGDITFGENNVFADCGFTIYSWSNSPVEQYAQGHNFEFEALSLEVPKNVSIVNEISGVRISWNKVKGANNYSVYRSEEKDGTYTEICTMTSALSFMDKTAKSGKTYYYYVSACGDYESSKTDSVKHTYIATPTITSRANMAAGIKLGWNKIANATGYVVYRKAGDSAWVRVYTAPTGDTVSWTDTAVKANNGKVYKYTVRALIGNTTSACHSSGVTMVRLTSRDLTSAVKASKTSIKCKWSTSSAVSGYEIRFVVAGKVYKTVVVGNYKTGTKTFTGLATNKKYQVQVRSYKKTDVGTFYSAWSTAKYVQL